MTKTFGPMVLSGALCAALAGCSNDLTGPSDRGYDGQWTGTTSQGVPITVEVSAAERVTAITVGYRFNGCSGSRRFGELSLAIGTSQLPTGNPQVPSPFSNPGFGYGSGSPEEQDYTQIYGAFTSPDSATGSIIFAGYPGCGSSTAIWNASRR